VVPVADLAVEAQFVRIPESDAPVIRLPLVGSSIHATDGAFLHQFGELAVHGRVTRTAH
jgi:hypothetical protein